MINFIPANARAQCYSQTHVIRHTKSGGSYIAEIISLNEIDTKETGSVHFICSQRVSSVHGINIFMDRQASGSKLYRCCYRTLSSGSLHLQQCICGMFPIVSFGA